MRASTPAHPILPVSSGGSRASLLLLAILQTVLVACTGPDRGSTGASAVLSGDSSGVEIVEIPGDRLEALPRWGFATEPTVSIGAVEGELPYLLEWVTAAGVLESGEIFVADNGTREVRVFDAGGQYVRSYGGEGRGPGEFRSLDNVSQTDGRTISAFDYPATRTTTIDLIAGDVTMKSTPPRCRVAGETEPSSCQAGPVFPDGTNYGSRSVGDASSPPPGGPDRLTVRPGGWRQYGPVDSGEIQVVDSIRRADAVQRGWGTSDYFGGPALFSPAGGVALGVSTLAVGDPAHQEIRLRTRDGRLERIVRFVREPTPVTDALLDRYRAWADTAERARPITHDYLDAFEPEGAVPAFGGLRVDRVGRIWIADYRPFWAWGPTPPAAWTILDSTGQPLARIEGGAPGSILEIGEDYILVNESDELGVEYVRMYDIVRPTRTVPAVG